MGALALLALFGMVGAVAILGNEDDDQQTQADEAIEEEAPSPEGEVLEVNGDSTITGTDGNDTLVAVPRTSEEVELLDQTTLIDMGAGDDVVEISEYYGGRTVLGGEGDDSITSFGEGLLIEGGEGDDTIHVGSADQVLGGAGDDLLTFVTPSAYYNVEAVLDGGEGDDTIRIDETFGGERETGDASGISDIFLGGSGNDTFELNLTLNDYGDENPTSPDHSSLRLDDFTAGEDVLIINVDRSEDEGGRELLSTEIERQSFTVDGETTEYAVLVMTFAATENDPTAIARVRFNDPDVTLDDVIFQTS